MIAPGLTIIFILGMLGYAATVMLGIRDGMLGSSAWRPFSITAIVGLMIIGWVLAFDGWGLVVDLKKEAILHGYAEYCNDDLVTWKWLVDTCPETK